jgi:hypothetical protein
MKNKKPVILCALLGALCIYSAFCSPSEYWLRQRVVKLTGPGGHGSCSGEQVKAPSGKNYILTAAHCLSLKDSDGNIKIHKEDKSTFEARVVAEDDASDLALLDGVPNFRGIDVASEVQAHSLLRTFTHGAGLDTYKTEGELISYSHIFIPTGLIGSDAEESKCVSQQKNTLETIDILPGISVKICVLDVWEAATSALVVPGSSGGMVVNDEGSLVGVVSATDGHLGFLVKLSDIRRFLSGY